MSERCTEKCPKSKTGVHGGYDSEIHADHVALICIKCGCTVARVPATPIPGKNAVEYHLDEAPQ